MTRSVLVTGGAGFLGSHLCDQLLCRGYEVLCLDNFFTGRKQNIQHLLTRSNFELIRHDIEQPILLEVEQIYNLACPASPMSYQHDAIKTVKTNVMGAIHVLGLAKRLQARVLQASTSEIYGDPHIHPQVESYWGNVNCIGQRACYDEGKRVAETLFFDYHRQNQVDIRVARIFNTYGPRMLPDDGRVVSNFIVQALTHQPITIYGDGTQTRSFCFVDDMVQGLIQLMENETITGPVNLGNPQETSILELAQTIIELCQSKSRLVHKALPSDDPIQRKPDIRQAREKLEWTPTTNLTTGLKKTIAYFQNVLPKRLRPD